jgi:hypothetical protein
MNNVWLEEVHCRIPGGITFVEEPFCQKYPESLE